MRRIITLDIVRGGAAIGVFTVHAVLFQILAGVDNSVTTFTEVLGIFILPIEIIIASAGLFVLIAGISNAGIMYHLLKAGKKPKTLLKDTLIVTELSFALQVQIALAVKSTITMHVFLNIFSQTQSCVMSHFMKMQPCHICLNSSVIMKSLGIESSTYPLKSNMRF